VSASEKRSRSAPNTEMTRRKFVTMVAAGSAALLTQPLASLAAAKRKAAAQHGAPRSGAAGAHKSTPAASSAEKEFQRQRASTLETLKTIRAHKLPAGSEMAFVFRALKPARKERG